MYIYILLLIDDKESKKILICLNRYDYSICFDVIAFHGDPE